MTKDEFMNQLDSLLNNYCTANPDYQNLFEVIDKVQINTPKVKQGVRVVISMYLHRKEE